MHTTTVTTDVVIEHRHAIGEYVKNDTNGRVHKIVGIRADCYNYGWYDVASTAGTTTSTVKLVDRYYKPWEPVTKFKPGDKLTNGFTIEAIGCYGIDKGAGGVARRDDCYTLGAPIYLYDDGGWDMAHAVDAKCQLAHKFEAGDIVRWQFGGEWFAKVLETPDADGKYLVQLRNEAFTAERYSASEFEENYVKYDGDDHPWSVRPWIAADILARLNGDQRERILADFLVAAFGEQLYGDGYRLQVSADGGKSWAPPAWSSLKPVKDMFQ